MTNPPSPAQFKFIADLLAQVPAALTGINDIPAAIEALKATPSFDKRTASKMIEQLLSLKAQAPATAATATAAPGVGKPANQYPGPCQNCKATVAPGDGWRERSGTGKWLVFHNACPAPVAAAPAVAPLPDPVKGLYVLDGENGTIIARVYITQNGHTAVKYLRDLGGHGSFEYVKGGKAVVARHLAAGTGHLMTAAEATAFGADHGWCVNCGLELTDDRSLAVAYGPVCAGHNGWFYPSYEEAARMLGRPVTKPSGVVVTPEGVTTAPTAPDAGDGNVAGLVDTEAPRPWAEIVGTWICDQGAEHDTGAACDCPAECPDCGAPLADVAGEPCLQGTPDWRGQYPVHTLHDGDDDDDTEPF